MTIKFIIPNTLAKALKEGISAMGRNLTKKELKDLMEDINGSMNTAIQQKYVRENLSDIIPADLPVCVSSHRDGNLIMLKYNLPRNDTLVKAAIAFKVDTTYESVLMLTQEYMNDHDLIRHELVHYDQIKRGDLALSENGFIRWKKPGQEFEINALQNMVERNKAAGMRSDELMYHELQKPWEVEAYALTTPKEQLDRMSPRCREIIDRYLQENLVTS